MIRSATIVVAVAGTLVLLAGCTTTPSAQEHGARDRVAAIGDELRSAQGRLPVLGEESPP